MNAIPPTPVAPDLHDLSPWWPRPLPEAPEPLSEAARSGAAAVSGLCIVAVSNWPTEANIAAATEWNPASAPLLEEWHRICAGAVDGATAATLSRKNETCDETARYVAYVEKEDSRRLAEGDVSGAAYMRAYRHDRDGKPSGTHRDWQAHVVDDAARIVSLRHAVPGDTFVVMGAHVLVLEGHASDGSPTIGTYALDDSTRDVREVVLKSARQECPVDWRHPAFVRNAGRAMTYVSGQQDLDLTLLAMRRAGHLKAFVKSTKSKAGTWTVDLGPVRTIADAAAETTRARRHDLHRSTSHVVQAHSPFVAEQRFFVIGGRIAASVCSARSLCAVDALPGHRLDSRVARLAVPEIERGAYDRGHADVVEDRRLSARFARLVRRVVRELGAEDLFDYVVDAGLSADGSVSIVELNSLHKAGPYCLDRRLTVEAHRRARTRFLRGLGVDDAVPGALVSSMRGRIGTQNSERYDDNWQTRTEFHLADREVGTPENGAAATPRIRPRFVEPGKAGILGSLASALLADWEPLFAVGIGMERGTADGTCFVVSMRSESPTSLWLGTAWARRPSVCMQKWSVGTVSGYGPISSEALGIDTVMWKAADGSLAFLGSRDDPYVVHLHLERLPHSGTILVASIRDRDGRLLDEKRTPLPPFLKIVMSRLVDPEKPGTVDTTSWSVPDLTPR